MPLSNQCPFQINAPHPKLQETIKERKEPMAFDLSAKDKRIRGVEQKVLLCCKFYVSESRNRSALEAIERAASVDPESVIVKKFEDIAYNRTRYSIVSYVVHDSSGNAIYSPLHQTIMGMTEAAFSNINLEFHSGAHPRLGVVDDIAFHPLARASLHEAAWLARVVAADIASMFQVPVYLYSAAHPTGKAPDDLRRELGYFRPNYNGNQWAGWSMTETLPEKPDEGPNTVSRARGITMIGARPWMATYNIPILSNDVSAVRRIARMVSGRGGGLPTVQTMALLHDDDTTEIACNLLEPNQIGADRVQRRAEMLAAQFGLEVENGYFTDYSQEMIMEKYFNLISGNKNQPDARLDHQ